VVAEEKEEEGGERKSSCKVSLKSPLLSPVST